MATSHLALAEVLLEIGQSAAALQHIEEAARIAGDDNPDLAAVACVLEARAALALGKKDQALSLLEEAQKRVAESDELELRVRFQLTAASWCEETGDVAGARSLIAAAQEAVKGIHPLYEMDSAVAAGALEFRRGDRETGRRQLTRLLKEAEKHDYGLAVARLKRLLAPPAAPPPRLTG